MLNERLSAAVIFESALLLRKYPIFNAFCSAGVIHYYQEVNVGYAVDIGTGLKVFVVRNADTKTLPQIIAERREAIENLLNNELRLETLAGGTFTVTDLSGEGVLSFDPLISAGQSAILGVGAVSTPLGASMGTYNLILAFDHQIAEGRLAARFLGELRERLEAYETAMFLRYRTEKRKCPSPTVRDA